MSQVTTGVRSLLSSPLVYETFQYMMGASKGRDKFVSRFIKPYDVKTILDIGCGPAEILSCLDNVDYYGYDISTRYIESAKHRYADKGKFFNKAITMEDLADKPKFDFVLMHGLLHHVDDNTAIKLLTVAHAALKTGGRLVTADGCLVEKQNPIARFLIKNDRGQNVKTQSGYTNLVNNVFEEVKPHIHHQSWIPYTLCYLECTKR